MIFTWGIELLLLWGLNLAIGGGGQFGLWAAVTGLIDAAVALAAHLSLAAAWPLVGNDAPSAPYRSEVSNAYLSLHLGLALSVFTRDPSAWGSALYQLWAYAMAGVMLLPALGLALASYSGRGESNWLVFHRHTLVGVVWGAFLPSLPCSSGVVVAILCILLTLTVAAHALRLDVLATGMTLVSLLVVGGWGLMADMSTVPLGVLITQIVVLVLSVVVQLVWTVGVVSSAMGAWSETTTPSAPTAAVLASSSSSPPPPPPPQQQQLSDRAEGGHVFASMLHYHPSRVWPQQQYAPLAASEPGVAAVAEPQESQLFHGLFDRAGVRARGREKCM